MWVPFLILHIGFAFFFFFCLNFFLGSHCFVSLNFTFWVFFLFYFSSHNCEMWVHRAILFCFFNCLLLVWTVKKRSLFSKFCFLNSSNCLFSVQDYLSPKCLMGPIKFGDTLCVNVFLPIIMISKTLTIVFVCFFNFGCGCVFTLLASICFCFSGLLDYCFYWLFEEGQ